MCSSLAEHFTDNEVVEGSIPSTPTASFLIKLRSASTMDTFELIGFLGTIIVTGAYFPQIIKILWTKDANGISITAWSIWLLGTAMILTHAYTTGDRVFILFQSLSFALIFVVLFLALRYRNK